MVGNYYKYYTTHILTIDALTIDALTIDALTIDALTMDALTMDTCSRQMADDDTFRFDFHASYSRAC